MLKVSLFPAYAPSYACQPDLSSNITRIQYVCITCIIRRTIIIHMYCTLCIMYCTLTIVHTYTVQYIAQCHSWAIRLSVRVNASMAQMHKMTRENSKNWLDEG